MTAGPTNVFYAADGTCISKPHLVLDNMRAIGIGTRINVPDRQVTDAKQ
jgi:hypothetical protein